MRFTVTVTLVLAFSLLFTVSAGAQSAAPMKSSPAAGGQMQDMHRQHMEAMKADVEKLRAAVGRMRSSSDDSARWQANSEAWQVLLSHMEAMQKNMESMHGRGMEGMHHCHGGRTDKPSSPPPQKK